MQKKKQRKNRKKAIKKILIVVLIIFILIFILLLSIQYGIIDYFKKISKEPEKIVINDDCSAYFGRIIHTIKSEGDCKINCNNDCSIRKMNFLRLEFTEYQDKCNICNCYCK